MTRPALVLRRGVLYGRPRAVPDASLQLTGTSLSERVTSLLSLLRPPNIEEEPCLPIATSSRSSARKRTSCTESFVTSLPVQDERSPTS